ncbi:MAG: hypothetical protein PHV68_00215 [Candidatus Gastranaerophilales bacterium]|nr:hypothetical protein [Candidatus Gastranaerophilales bacterium]
MKKRNGAALLMVVILSTLLLLVVMSTSINAVSDMGLTNDEKIRTRLEFACLSGLKRAKYKAGKAFNNGDLVFLEPYISFQGSSADDSGLTPTQRAFDDETFIPNGSNDYYEFTYQSDEDNREITIRYAITEAQDWTKSQSFTAYQMNIEAIAFSEGYGWVGMSQDIVAKRTTLFMYQIFFQDELEILPGPNFNLNGLIHTNSDLYLNANNTLNIYTDSLTSAGEIHRGRLDSTAINGTVRISKDDEDGSLVTMTSSMDADNEDWIDIAQNAWGGTVRDKNLGATVLEVPDLQSFEPGGYYDTNSDLKINVLAEGKTKSNTIYEITYNGVTNSYKSSDIGYALKDVTFYDQREYGTSQKIRVTEVDVEKLATQIGYPTNGLIYMTRDDAIKDSDGNEFSPDSSREVAGFKLKNAGELPDASTFVTDMPVYVQGDFNLHTSSDPNVDTWQPCAIISDAITLLSNSWNDSNSSTIKPTASNTTYNTVFITGNNPTKYGQYSGGLENFPRFLENWSGKDANIAGGFIQLFRSQYATGLWSGNYYNAPNRNWGAEDRFSNLEDLPPSYANLFPSTSIGLAESDWRMISKNESNIYE